MIWRPATRYGGQPGVPGPPNVEEAAIAAIRAGKHGYTPSAGIDELRSAAQRDIGARRGHAIAPDAGVVGAAELASQVDQLIDLTRAAGESWAARPASERATILRQAARDLEARRGELVAAMAAEGGKTIEQSAPAVSEAIDFARSYAFSAEDLAATGLTQPGSRARYAALFAGERTAIEAFKSWLAAHKQRGERLLDISESRPPVRGAIDLTMVAAELRVLRDLPATDPGVTRDAAQRALSGRGRVRDGCGRTAAEIVDELWAIFFAPEADDDPETGEPDGDDSTGKGQRHHLRAVAGPTR